MVFSMIFFVTVNIFLAMMEFVFPQEQQCFEYAKTGETPNTLSGILSVSFEEFIQTLNEGVLLSVRDSSKKLNGKPTFFHREIDSPDSEAHSAFMTTSRGTYQCVQGKLYYKLSKKKVDEKRFRMQNTKKRNCPAMLSVFWIDSFPDFNFKNGGNWRQKKKVLDELSLKLLSNDNSLRRQQKIYITLNLLHNRPVRVLVWCEYSGSPKRCLNLLMNHDKI